MATEKEMKKISRKLRKICADYDINLVAQIIAPDDETTGVFYVFNEHCALGRTEDEFTLDATKLNNTNARQQISNALYCLTAIGEISEIHQSLVEEAVDNIKKTVEEGTLRERLSKDNVVPLFSEH